MSVIRMTSSSPRCPKCGGEMEKGRHLASYTEITLAKKDHYVGDYIAPLLCKNCGYIELYKEQITRLNNARAFSY